MTAHQTALAALEKMIEMTPYYKDQFPSDPGITGDAGDLASRGAELIEARSGFFSDLQNALSQEPDLLSQDDRARKLLVELRKRDASWMAALTRASCKIGDRLVRMRTGPHKRYA